MTVPLDHAGLHQALQHERALRRLAAALLRDPADVDDAVEHTLVQEARGLRQPGTPLWPFLRTTLQRYADNLRKLAMRRAKRERSAARPERLPAVDELVQREQLRRHVADAMLALEEPYRTTVWLRWVEELPASEVAARMQVPVTTVRTRLQRAHAQLRQRLDAEYGDRRWAAFALPTPSLIAVPTVSSFAVVLTMKKVLAAVALLLFALLGSMALSPSDPALQLAKREETTAAVTAEPSESPPLAVKERQQLLAAPTPDKATARFLSIEHADGSPAANLPVWFWSDDATRPGWTRRVDAHRTWGNKPAGMGEAPHEEPPTTPLRTDASGRIAWPAGTTPVAVTVECVESQWFSAEVPDANAALVLPAMAVIEATVQGAPPGGAWEGAFYGAWLEPDGKNDDRGPMRKNVDTRSGHGVMRMGVRRFHFDVGQGLRTFALQGQLCAIHAWGHGFALRNPADELVAAPGAVEFRCVRLQQRLLVTVTEPDGSPTSAAGKVLVMEDKGCSEAPLERGVASFGFNDLAAGRHMLEVSMADGEWIFGSVDCDAKQMEVRATLSRASAQQPVHVRLRELPAIDSIAQVYVEDGAHELRAAQEFARYYTYAGPDTRREACFIVSGNELLLNMLPTGWSQGYVVARDGRVAHFGSGMPGETITGNWLPSLPPQTIDVAAIYRELGDRPAMHAVLIVELLDSQGRITSSPVLSHHRTHEQEQLEAPPVWSGLHLPQSLRARLRVEGGRTDADSTLLRDIQLPRH